jgi:hypothetical protein
MKKSNTQGNTNLSLSYNNLIGGKLKLKNVNAKTVNHVKKMISRDINLNKRENNNKKVETSDIPNDELIGQINKDEEEYIKHLENLIREDDDKPKTDPKSEESPFSELIPDNRTAAEKLFEERKLKRLPDKIKKTLQTNFKQKYQNYSKMLSKLPEHYDIPKVGPG